LPDNKEKKLAAPVKPQPKPEAKPEDVKKAAQGLSDALKKL